MKKILTLITSLLLCVWAGAKEKEVVLPDIMPYPQEMTAAKGTFNAKGAAFNCDSRLDAGSRKAIQQFCGQLSLVSGKVSTFAAPAGLAKTVANGNAKGFNFVRNSSLKSEEYTITMTGKSIVIETSSYNGTLYAIQTLKQMMPVEIYGTKPVAGLSWKMQCVNIKDEPRFAYRGMHLDCSRHFFSVDEVKRYLSIMATYKLNRLHWHLSDDQGWRVEIASYPEFTEIGAYRNGTMIGRDFSSNDGIRYGGYYTQEQVRDIIAYAANLGITVIPEIDLPGHMLGVLAAHPEFGCTGGPYEVWTKWGVADDVLCPGKEGTFEMLEKVLGELADLFPSEYFHIGGDECPKVRWHDCPDCQKRIAELGLKDDEHGTAEQYLQNYVTSRVQAFLATKGKKIIGWDEILEGKLGEGATVMSWRGTSGGIKAANMGFDVIMTPTDYCYFDYLQSKDTDKEPVGIGGFLPAEKVYGYEPLEGLSADAKSHILGVQANLWTEYIATPEHLEYMLLPRMQALCEVQWCKPEDKSFDRWMKSITEHQFKVLDMLGYNYRRF